MARHGPRRAGRQGCARHPCQSRAHPPARRLHVHRAGRYRPGRARAPHGRGRAARLGAAHTRPGRIPVTARACRHGSRPGRHGQAWIVPRCAPARGDDDGRPARRRCAPHRAQHVRREGRPPIPRRPGLQLGPAQTGRVRLPRPGRGAARPRGPPRRGDAIGAHQAARRPERAHRHRHQRAARRTRPVGAVDP